MRHAATPPFVPEPSQAYLRWREHKLAHYPRRVEDLIVEVRDPRHLSGGEVEEIQRLCRVANMAIYSTPFAGRADKDVARRLGEQLGLARPHANPLADDDGISSLEVAPAKSALGYIPYSNRRLLWHTDGYYSAPGQSIRAFTLHCVRPADTGGENGLLDHDIAYILLRDADPGHIEALEAPDAMTIPAGTLGGAQSRPSRTGPVFSTQDGALHMRYTARTRSIEWRRDNVTHAAVNFLESLLEAPSQYVLSVRLAAGQGLVCNNVLHSRGAFADDPAPGKGRLVYRARYLDRIAQGAPARVF